MKAFLFGTTTNDDWEICGGSYLVKAESKEEAKQILESNLSTNDRFKTEVIDFIEEIYLSVKGFIDIQEPIIE